MTYGLHWFRRDLRLHGNPAITWSADRHQGRVLGIFFFDPVFLSRVDFSAHRFAFFLESLNDLQLQFRKRGGDLLVLDKGPENGFREVLNKLKESKIGLPQTVSFNRDYEPFARERDAKIEKLLTAELGIETHSARDHLLLEPHEVLKPDGTPYRVYSAFARQWFDKLKTSEIQNRLMITPLPRFSSAWSNAGFIGVDRLEAYREKNKKNVSISIPEAGEQAAAQTLKRFVDKIGDYGVARDVPSANGTSEFSIFLKNGSLNIGQVIKALDLKRANFSESTGQAKFLKELVWREFYYSILFHWPRVEKEAFIEKFKNLQWENREDYFEAWKEGRTGYPIVDAGMRQLNETGWLHNRVRMIVGSFLTKDLLIDWRWGERYFMEKLLDGDLAPNNGGWQWVASTGVDPQPYFRIFNPLLQSKKFDPNGDYIRKFVPELRNVDPKKIHQPDAQAGYPRPIVDHVAQKFKVLKLYKGP